MTNIFKHCDPAFLDCKNPSKFFKYVVSALWISEEEVQHLAKPFYFTLVSKFPLRRPKLTGGFLVTLLDQQYVLIKLSNDLDYGRVFVQRSYYVSNYFIKLIKWSCFFDILEESPILPIWLSFPDLHPHFFSPRILHSLGSLFGRLIQTDNATAVGSKPSVAPILIELGITKNFCSHFKALGHKKVECLILHPHLRKSDIPKLGSEMNNSLVLVRDSYKMLLNDHNSTLDNVHLGKGSLMISPIKPLSDVVCVHSNADSPLSFLNGSFDVVDNIVVSSSNPIIDFDLPIEGLDVSDSIPIIDLPIFVPCWMLHVLTWMVGYIRICTLLTLLITLIGLRNSQKWLPMVGSLELSCAKASQNALWVMKLSRLH
ncbi:hypothetical protein M5K25_016255 [Dendrobium thyrsiflorum]|uniref:DUF4283 domain-containing protein n=1 Tax=Dendrobium thyrsiflorum TaxID=117978 RepID=A0ABD0UK19_DENTH